MVILSLSLSLNTINLVILSRLNDQSISRHFRDETIKYSRINNYLILCIVNIVFILKDIRRKIELLLNKKVEIMIKFDFHLIYFNICFANFRLSQACKHAMNDGKCVSQCPPPLIVSREESRTIANPEFKYNFHDICVKKCPGTLNLSVL